MSSDPNAAYERLRKQGHSGWGGAKFDARMDGWRRELAAWTAVAHFPKTGRVLELGCGNGAVASLFAALGYRVTGVDVSLSAVSWAVESFRTRRLPGEFYCDDVSQGMKRFDDGQFDVVVDGNCLHCVLGDARQQALAAVKRVLTADGLFVVSSMCGAPHSAEAKKDFDPKSNLLRRDGAPYRYLPPTNLLIDEIADAGFRPVQWRVQENEWWDHLWMLAAHDVRGR